MTYQILFAELPIESVGASTPVRPGRSRTRSKNDVEEKARNVPDAKKKSPPIRKTPSRGRYVDEYAQPPA